MMLAMIIGTIALFTSLIGFQLEKPKNIIKTQMLANIIWALHFLCLGATLASVSSLISASRYGFVRYISAKHLTFTCVLFLTLLMANFILNYKHLIDILPFVGSSISTLSLLLRDNRAIIARGMLLSCILWTLYSLLIYSYPAVICFSLSTISTIIGMARHENWTIGRCYRSFIPSLARALYIKPQTYP